MDFYRVNSKFRTYNFTIMAIYAIIHFLDKRGMITLLIKFFRELEDLLGAEFNTIPTPFAPVFEDMHNTLRNLDLF